MNTKVQEFIDKRKKEEKEKELKQREELLISLGLIDESKTKRERKYDERYFKGAKFDEGKNMYYTESIEYHTIEVTDEEFEEILKYAPVENKDKKDKKISLKNSIKKTLVYCFIAFLLGSTLVNFFERLEYSQGSINYVSLSSNINTSIICLMLFLCLMKLHAISKKK